MPLILNGSTLLKNTSGGLATTTACCCGQNPKECFCPDPCQYYAEITSPSFAAISGRLAPLGPCLSVGNVEVISDLICGADYTIGSKDAGNDNAGVSILFGKQSSAEGDNFTCESGILYAQARLFCSNTSDANLTPRIIVVIDYRIDYGVTLFEPFPFDTPPYGCGSDAKFGQPGNQVDFGNFSISCTGFFEVPYECKTTANKFFCGDVPASRTAQFDTPLTVTLSHDSGNGAPWESRTSLESGNQDLVQEVKDCLKNTPVTFVFGRRPSCRPVDCNCGVDLSGMKAVFDGKEFTVGQTDEQTTFSGENGEFEEYWSHYESAGIYYFVYERWLGPGKLVLYERRAATLFCDNDEESSPTVQRWYVEFEMTCRTYDEILFLIEETTKTEIGYYNCELGEFCSGLAGDQPVPTGSPLEIEEAPGSPETTDGLNSCTPPARPSLALSCQ